MAISLLPASTNCPPRQNSCRRDMILNLGAIRMNDGTDAFQHRVEIIPLPQTRRVLQPLVVHGEALHQILAQARRRPLAELRTTMAADTEARRKEAGKL